MKRANKTANVTYETDASLARSQEHVAQAINKSRGRTARRCENDKETPSRQQDV